MRAVIFALLVFWPVCLQADPLNDWYVAFDWQSSAAKPNFSLPGMPALQTLLDRPSGQPTSTALILLRSEEKALEPQRSFAPFLLILPIGLWVLALLTIHWERPLQTNRFRSLNVGRRHPITTSPSEVTRPSANSYTRYFSADHSTTSDEINGARRNSALAQSVKRSRIASRWK